MLIVTSHSLVNVIFFTGEDRKNSADQNALSNERRELSKLAVKVVAKNMLILKKRPMGHIAHLRKQFKSINTYDYI